MSTQDEEILAVAREGFLEEARDMLRQFEQALLAMEQDPADAESINTAFRAAHTVKGAAGLFGFDAVVEFTHEVESLLEDMRSGSLAISDDAMRLLLLGRDQMERLLDDVGCGRSDAGTLAASDELGAQLRALRGGAVVAPSPGPHAQDDATVSGSPDGQASWHVSLRMGPDALRNGLDPLSFIRYLGTLGSVVALHTFTDAVPALDEIDPEACYLGFEIRLRSAAERVVIEGVFEFLLDDCSLLVLGPDPAADDFGALLQRHAETPQDRAALSHVLRAMGAFDEAPDAPESRTAGTQRSTREADGSTSEPERRTGEPERRTAARDRRAGDETRFIRVRADKLDRLIDLIGELVIASSGAQMVAQQERSPLFAEAALRINDLVQEARDGALGLRMVPIGETFSRFQRVVRDVSRQLGKDVELEISGGDTELDKTMVETIADPLMHLVRNSLDHGLETPDERAAAGKPRQGRLALNAYHEAGSVIIEVSDDGRGLNRARILAKAVERGLVDTDASLDDDEVCQLIFQPGFSTAEQVTNLSGRGVGMDVVKRNVEALRGQIRIASQPGEGSMVQIRLPLTLAIIDGFLTTVAGIHYVVPMDAVVECIETPPPATASRAGEDGRGCFDLRGEVLPCIDLRSSFGHDGERPARQSTLIVRTERTKVGLLVDRLLGQHQTVIKPLGRVLAPLRGIAGSTVLGSGDVALVLDVSALVQGLTRTTAPYPPAAQHAASH